MSMEVEKVILLQVHHRSKYSSTVTASFGHSLTATSLSFHLRHMEEDTYLKCPGRTTVPHSLPFMFDGKTLKVLVHKM